MSFLRGPEDPDRPVDFLYSLYGPDRLTDFLEAMKDCDRLVVFLGVLDVVSPPGLGSPLDGTEQGKHGRLADRREESWLQSLDGSVNRSHVWELSD